MSVHLPAPDHRLMDPAPVLYAIRIHGHLGATVLSAFPALVPQHNGADTVLTGLLDRSALYGVLAEVEALGLDLVEIRQLMPDGRSPESGDGRPPRWQRAPAAPGPATRRCGSHDQCPRPRPTLRSSPRPAECGVPAHRLPAPAAGRGPFDRSRPPGQERRLHGQDHQDLRG